MESTSELRIICRHRTPCNPTTQLLEAVLPAGWPSSAAEVTPTCSTRRRPPLPGDSHQPALGFSRIFGVWPHFTPEQPACISKCYCFPRCMVCPATVEWVSTWRVNRKYEYLSLLQGSESGSRTHLHANNLINGAWTINQLSIPWSGPAICCAWVTWPIRGFEPAEVPVINEQWAVGSRCSPHLPSFSDADLQPCSCHVDI
ncbi:hypothetical protein GE09DRAFT_109097 [Coniochaeta sp. 2T2.1]|nr:hypothetical protein GE09DRAFT_109097 [Coniochaeta sp. 2T2.1]